MVSLVQGRLTLEKLGGYNLFQPKISPKFKNLGGFTYRAANVSKFGGPFFAANYIETRGLI